MGDEQGNSISADQILPTASAISTRGPRGVRTKSRAQLAWEWQERLDLDEKGEKAPAEGKGGSENESKKAVRAERRRLIDSRRISRTVKHELFLCSNTQLE